MNKAQVKGQTVRDDEIKRFEAIASEWWDPSGKFKPLHKFNPVRVSYIREKLIEHFKLDEKALQPFEGIKILDVGCGGGLLCEPMARLGAQVTGLDVGETAIAVATRHAEEMGLEIDYQCRPVEDLGELKESFDVVLNMEVVEHVADVALFMHSCSLMIKPGGVMFNATLNRTVKSYALAIIGAEYILGWLPRGTHNWQQFITPDELKEHLQNGDLFIQDELGVVYNPLADRWSKSKDMDVNYMILAEKPAN